MESPRETGSRALAVAASAAVVFLGVMLVWLIRTGAGTAPPETPFSLDTLLQPAEDAPARARDGRGPLIGAFQARVAARLAAHDAPVRRLTGSLQISGVDAVWREGAGAVFARAESLSGRLDLDALRADAIILTSVAVERPVVWLRERSGDWNYEVVLAELLDDGDEDDGEDGFRRVAIRQGVVRNGVVNVDRTADDFTIEELDGTLRQVVFVDPDVPEPLLEIDTGSAVVVLQDPERRVPIEAGRSTVRLLEDVVAFEVDSATVRGVRLADVTGRWDPTFPFYGLHAEGRVLEAELAGLDDLLPEGAPREGTASFAWSIEPVGATFSEIALTGISFRSGGSSVAGDLAVRAEDEGRYLLRSAALNLAPFRTELIEPMVDSLPFTGEFRGTVTGSEGEFGFQGVADLQGRPAGEPFTVRVDGQFDVGPEGIALERVAADLEQVPLAALAAFAPGLPLAGTATGRVLLSGPPERAPLDVDVRLDLANGAAVVRGTLDLTGSLPTYDLAGQLVAIDLAMLFRPPAPPVRLTAAFQLAGRGFDPASAEARFTVAGGFEGWWSTPADTVDLSARLDGGAVQVEAATLELAGLAASAEGRWRFVEPIAGNVTYDARFSSLEPWGPYLPLIGDTLAAGTLALSGTITGPLAAPELEGRVSGDEIRFGDWSAAAIESEYRLALDDSIPQGTLQALVSDLVTPTAGGFPTVTIAARMERPRFILEVEAEKEDGGVVQVAANGRLPAVGPRDLVLERAVVDLAAGRWTLAMPAAFRWGGEDGFTVESFEMRQENTGGLIRLDGTVLPLDRAEFTVRTEALPLGEIQELFGIRPYASGELTLDAAVRGPPQAPQIEATYLLANGAIENIPVIRLEGTFAYSEAQLRGRTVAVLDTLGSVELEVELPARIDLEGERRFELVDDGPINGTLVATQAPLAPLAATSPYVRDVRGFLNGRVLLGGSVAAPEFDGRLVLTNGSAVVPLLSQDYPDISGEVTLAERTAVIDVLRATSDGTATVTGSIVFDELTSPSADLTMRFDRFRALGVPDREDAAFYGDISLTGEWDALTLTGAVRIADGYVRIPEFRSQLDQEFGDLDRLQGTEADIEAADSGNPLLEGLTVDDLRVTFENDVWFTAEPARAQLTGALALNGPVDEIIVEGTLQGSRGMYTLQAGPIVRRFEIVEAEVRFLGTPEPDPALDILAQRLVFLPGGAPVEVDVRIGGTLQHPTLSLASADAPNFPESELLSILFFGRPSLELGGGGLPGEDVLEATFVGGLAELATLELEQTLVEDLGLSFDIFQVRFGPGGIGGFTPSFVFGWELSSDVFLTAEYGMDVLLASGESAGSTWALRLEWAFSPRSQLTASYEPVLPSRALRSLGQSLLLSPPPHQVSAQYRRRWTY